MFGNLAVAEFFTMFLIMCMVLVVLAYYGANLEIIMSIEIMTLLLGVAIGWVDTWVTILIAMAVGGLWSFGFMSNALKE